MISLMFKFNDKYFQRLCPSCVIKYVENEEMNSVCWIKKNQEQEKDDVVILEKVISSSQPQSEDNEETSSNSKTSDIPA